MSSRACNEVGRIVIGAIVSFEICILREAKESSGFAFIMIAIGTCAMLLRQSKGKAHGHIGHNIAMLLLHMKRRQATHVQIVNASFVCVFS